MKLKQLLLCFIAFGCYFSSYSQNNTDLKLHFEKYYAQMKNQGDVQGLINAMTHLNILDPSTKRRDTLAYLYLSEGKNLQALNTLGITSDPSDSDMNVEVKALALKNLKQPKLAIEQYERLFKRNPSVYIAYDLADLKLQIKDFSGAKINLEYALSNVKPEMKRAFYESQQPYEASMKAAILYLKGLLVYSEDNLNNIDASIALMNEALSIDPNFNMAKLSRQALENQKSNTKK